MMPMMWMYLIVVTQVLLPAAYGDSIEPMPPLAVTERSSVDITCITSLTKNPGFEGVRMKKLLPGAGFENICDLKPPDFKPSDITDPNKYSVAKLPDQPTSFTLTIKNIEFEDAKRYRCGLIVDDKITQLTTLVVVRAPTLTVMDKLKAGQKTQMTCDVQYEIPANLDKSTEYELFPKISATIADRPISGVLTENPGNLIMTWNATLAEEDDQKEIVCKAYTNRPTYQVTSAKVLNVFFDVRNVKMDPFVESYRVGDQINCTAEGNPRPDIKWVPIASNTHVNIGPLLQIVNAMIGDRKEEWKCVASNRVSGMDIKEVFKSISFTVVRPTEPPVGEQKTSSTAAIAVGVAVPVVAIIAIVVIVVIVLKKKKENSFKPEDPPSKSPFTDIDAVDFGPHNIDPSAQPLKPATSARQPKPNKVGHNVSFSEESTGSPSTAPLLEESGKPNNPKETDQKQGASTEIDVKPDVMAETEKPRLADLANQVMAHGEMPLEQYDVPHQRAPVTATEFPDIAAAHPGLQQAFSKPKPLPRKQSPNTAV